MKYFIQLFLLSLLLIFVGCQTNSTFYETPVIIQDQVFTLPERSQSGTVIGQVKVTNPSENRLNYFLVSGENSAAFEMETLTGRLLLKDSSLINFQTIKQISLEVMVGYENSSNNFGVFANVVIQVQDLPDPYTWIANLASGKNQDALVTSSQPDSNIDRSNYFFAAAWTNNLQPYITRSFLQFDLTSIPANVFITGATLSLYNPKDGNINHEQSCFSGSNAFCIRRITSQWDSQTVTWYNQPALSFEGQVILPECKSAQQDYENIDIMDLIKYMVQNPDKNFGFVIMLEDENYYRRLCFASMNYPVENLRPKLVINYLK